MRVDYLGQLSEAVRLLLADRSVIDAIARLKADIRRTSEPFVWTVLDLAALRCPVPANIRSAWIFVLARDIGSGCHFHPNSIQHMVMVEGQGRSEIAGETRTMTRFGGPGHSLEAQWSVIGEGVPHEFFPEQRDMVVISFHTAAAQDLEEVSGVTGERRHYEAGR